MYTDRQSDTPEKTHPSGNKRTTSTLKIRDNTLALIVFQSFLAYYARFFNIFLA
jgi:hypothetical protein